MYGSSPVSKDLNLPFPPPSPHQHQMSAGLLRYRSAPSTLLGEMCEDLLPVRPSSPETETMFARFLGAPDLRDKPNERNPQFAPPPPASAAMEHRVPGVVAEEITAQQQMLYHSQQQQQQMPNHSPYRVVGSMPGMEAEQIKTGGGGTNCSNLIRHSSSPAGLFSHLNVENGYAVMSGIGGYRNTSGAMGEVGLPASRLKGQLSFSSRQSSSTGIMSQISEMGSEGVGASSPEESSNATGRCYIPGFPIGSWDDSPVLSDSFTGLKRARETCLNPSEPPQNGELRNSVMGMNTSDMATIEKFIQFQDSVPCKIRAKRGCATHPRSIAERVRRTRISERMRKLQELVPNMDKVLERPSSLNTTQTNTADMLDLAVEYIKDLQRHVKTMSDSRANCTCSSSKQKPYSNPSL